MNVLATRRVHIPWHPLVEEYQIGIDGNLRRCSANTVNGPNPAREENDASYRVRCISRRPQPQKRALALNLTTVKRTLGEGLKERNSTDRIGRGGGNVDLLLIDLKSRRAFELEAGHTNRIGEIGVPVEPNWHISIGVGQNKAGPQPNV